MATYLTSELFESLQHFLEKSKSLRKADKTITNLSQQHTLLYTLQILSANFKALGFCGVKLPDLMDDENYNAFLKTYQDAIVQVIELGYTEASP